MDQGTYLLSSAHRWCLALCLGLVFACNSTQSGGQSTVIIGGNDATVMSRTDSSNLPDAEPPLDADAPTIPEGDGQLSPEAHLVRVAMALMGTRPSVADLQAVRDDGDAIGGLIDRYLVSPYFGATIRDLHNVNLLLRPRFFWFPPLGDFLDMSLIDFNGSVQEAPLKLIEHVVMNDRPYTEVVTADYTVANGVVAGVWGLPYQGDGTQWMETQWPEDGREHAGLLSESYLFIRHYTTPLNAQRSRANTFSKLFLCHDFLDRDINLDGNVDLSDPAAVTSAVRAPECASCHQALDPLAAHFWTYDFFVSPVQIQGYPYSNFRPDYLNLRPFFTDRTPGYFGQEAHGLRALGQAIAGDPRFATCTVRRFYGYFAQIEPKNVPFELVAELTQSFIESGYNARALAKSVMLSRPFRTVIPSGDSVDAAVKGLLTVRPRQLSRLLKSLIGFSWEIDLAFPLFTDQGVDALYGVTNLLEDALIGYGVLAGGTDDFVVTDAIHSVGPTRSLVYQRLAFEIAGFVVERDLGMNPPDDDTRLLEISGTADEADLRDLLVRLHLRLFGEFVEGDGDAVNEAYQLFLDAVDQALDFKRAWKITLAALFQDSRIIFY